MLPETWSSVITSLHWNKNIFLWYRFSITEEDHPLNAIIFQRSGDRFADLKKTLEFPEKDKSVPKKTSNLLSENGNRRQDSSSTLQKYIGSEIQITSLSLYCVLYLTFFYVGSVSFWEQTGHTKGTSHSLLPNAIFILLHVDVVYK